MNSLVNKLCDRTSYRAISNILNGATLHDLQCVDVLTMLAQKRCMCIYDTGLGKTLLAGAAMKLLLREDPSRMFIMFVKKDQLVQTPAKLKSFANLSCLTTTAETAKAIKNFFNQDLTQYNVLMLTHNCLNNSEILNRIYEIRNRITGIIIDEAHELQNFNSASSADMLKAMLSKFEYVWALTATPITTDIKQLARLASLVYPEKYNNPARLAKDLEKGAFSIKYDRGFFINRKASDLGRISNPNGYVVAVSPSPSQKDCPLGGVEMFQVCKGEGAINQINALIDLINLRKSENKRGLVYISQTSILKWVISNLDKTDIRYACINGSTPISSRGVIEKEFADNKYDVILTSITTAVDLDCEYVVFYEFTVFVSQMIGRAHRGLEPKDLDVFFIITKDTNEQRYFLENIYSKCVIVKEILGKGNSAVEQASQRLVEEC